MVDPERAVCRRARRCTARPRWRAPTASRWRCDRARVDGHGRRHDARRSAGACSSSSHTPGHARHHHCIWDARTRTLFTGDTFGLATAELVNQPRPLDHADQRAGAVRARSAEGLGARACSSVAPAALCVTHYGRVRNVPHLGALLLEQIDDDGRHRRAPAPRRRSPCPRCARDCAQLYRTPPARTRLRRRRRRDSRCWRWTSRSTRRAWPAGSTAHRPAELDALAVARSHRMSQPSFAIAALASPWSPAPRKASAPPARAAWRATAPRWRCGTWTSRRRRRWPTSCAPARRQDLCAALRRVAQGRGRRRAGRHAAALGPRQRAGQQRRHLQGGRLPGHHRSRLGRRDRRQPQGRLPGRAGGGARDGRPRAAARSST